MPFPHHRVVNESRARHWYPVCPKDVLSQQKYLPVLAPHAQLPQTSAPLPRHRLKATPRNRPQLAALPVPQRAGHWPRQQRLVHRSGVPYRAPGSADHGKPVRNTVLAELS